MPAPFFSMVPKSRSSLDPCQMTGRPRGASDPLRTKRESATVMCRCPLSDMDRQHQGIGADVSGTASYLESLNPEQRRAVEHGATGEGPFAPLLVIAGAGSGKTNTLAHRVAHLIVCGADPRRILLMTFSRRAASEMTKRVERIAGPGMTPRWAGTFHAIANRLLRHHAQAVRLDPSFTVLDRSDAGDLMNVVRNELGFSQQASRFPKKDTCLAIYSHAVNAGHPVEQTLQHAFPSYARWAEELKRLF